MCSMADSNKANIGLSMVCLLCMWICRNLEAAVLFAVGGGDSD